ncbi:hypothetical protein Pcinc_033573 [Petrolisthes cinctipes]|uniref:Uncharacterized protein n=1 Tax=Petrolisthes cinctipes TaxID=88211 RepID=A0AAE1ERZ8_PETCI|nr:hypothetical protein Pcinc_033573 [Petrolisthes cinctipes]
MPLPSHCFPYCPLLFPQIISPILHSLFTHSQNPIHQAPSQPHPPPGTLTTPLLQPHPPGTLTTPLILCPPPHIPLPFIMPPLPLAFTLSVLPCSHPCTIYKPYSSILPMSRPFLQSLTLSPFFPIQPLSQPLQFSPLQPHLTPATYPTPTIPSEPLPPTPPLQPHPNSCHLPRPYNPIRTPATYPTPTIPSNPCHLPHPYNPIQPLPPSLHRVF